MVRDTLVEIERLSALPEAIPEPAKNLQQIHGLVSNLLHHAKNGRWLEMKEEEGK